jgi:hypothetical protein
MGFNSAFKGLIKHRDFTFYIMFVCVKKFHLFPVPFLSLLKIHNCFGTCMENVHIFIFILNAGSIKLSLAIHMQMNGICCNRTILIDPPIFPRYYTNGHNITTVK